MLRAKLLNDQYQALQAKHSVLISALKATNVGGNNYTQVLKDLKEVEEQMAKRADEIAALGPEAEEELNKAPTSPNAAIFGLLNNAVNTFSRICKDVAAKNGITNEDVQKEMESFKKIFSAKN